MREIKFRAWDGERMHYPDESSFVCLSGTGYQSLALWNVPKDGNDVICDSLDYPDFRLMQWTGLHDKNGREIYEADVVFAHGNGSRYVVKFGTHRSEYDHEGYEHGFYLQSKTGFQESMSGADECLEVIGNIYENPELLG